MLEASQVDQARALAPLLTTSFCAAGDGSGRKFTYDGTWKASPPTGTSAVHDVSCASASLCVAVDSAGRIVRWTGAAWTIARASGGYPLRGASCASAALCVAVGDHGLAVVSTDGGATWTAHQAAADRMQLNGIACPSVSVCVAVDVFGAAIASTDPAAGAWSRSAVGDAEATAVACAGGALCVMTDRDDYLHTAVGNGVPFNIGAPVVGGNATVGGSVHCSPGDWTPAPSRAARLSAARRFRPRGRG